ncbi:MAG: helix-turn-helix domain-containing protein [Muribaculaceae bacterium]|nr:helix-turn-helix domain-containing protein [Roseburia sp.]MCM1430017.1 helix-turn-helix domain-containing protein [Muribaculaceae bacterium]MCM1492956.1 helix-turn-helix domain-containing protein [Muribaculaceae bacterium]
MYNLELLVDSLTYIEQHIGENIRTEVICQNCGCSKSALEKVFRCVNGISVHDYITRRKMMYAALEISRNASRNILDIALDYGYTSNEAFSRAFKRIWNCKPSEFRNRKFYELYPKLRDPLKEGDPYTMSRKNVDISELYDLFAERKNCFFVCCDIKSLVPINEISRKAGDLAILEAMNRLNAEAAETDYVFRIGGDEFCVLTDSDSRPYAERLSQKITAHNGEAFLYEGREIPLTLYAAVTRYPEKNLKYNDLFQELHLAIQTSKN